MVKFSIRLKELRTEKKLTSLDLANLIGVTKATISFWENEVNEPKASYIIKLAEVFQVSTDYLLGLIEY